MLSISNWLCWTVAVRGMKTSRHGGLLEETEVMMGYGGGRWRNGIGWRKMEKWDMVEEDGEMRYGGGRWRNGIRCKKMEIWDMVEENGEMGYREMGYGEGRWKNGVQWRKMENWDTVIKTSNDRLGKGVNQDS